MIKKSVTIGRHRYDVNELRVIDVITILKSLPMIIDCDNEYLIENAQTLIYISEDFIKTKHDVRKLKTSQVKELFKVFIECNPKLLSSSKKDRQRYSKVLRKSMMLNNLKNINLAVNALCSIGHHNCLYYPWSLFMDIQDINSKEKG